VLASIWIPIPGKGDSLVPLAGDTTVKGFAMAGVWSMWIVVQAGVSLAWGDKTVPPPREVSSRRLKEFRGLTNRPCHTSFVPFAPFGC
jgi:hypothetical protein